MEPVSAPTSGSPSAGKTGTTDSYADAWFCGYTPNLEATVWVGYPRGEIPMLNVHGIAVAGADLPGDDLARLHVRGRREIATRSTSRCRRCCRRGNVHPRAVRGWRLRLDAELLRRHDDEDDLDADEDVSEQDPAAAPAAPACSDDPAADDADATPADVASASTDATPAPAWREPVTRLSSAPER